MKYVVGEPIQKEPAPKKRRPLYSIFKKRKEGELVASAEVPSALVLLLYALLLHRIVNGGGILLHKGLHLRYFVANGLYALVSSLG